MLASGNDCYSLRTWTWRSRNCWFPHEQMCFFHSFSYVYQRLNPNVWCLNQNPLILRMLRGQGELGSSILNLPPLPLRLARVGLALSKIWNVLLTSINGNNNCPSWLAIVMSYTTWDLWGLYKPYQGNLSYQPASIMRWNRVVLMAQMCLMVLERIYV
jgi:hypothetical protein